MGISESAGVDGHTISRRGFLTTGAMTVAAVAVLPLATAAPASATALSKAPAVMTRSTFTPLLQSTFRMVDASGRSVSVVLSQIADLMPAWAGSQTRFSLMFDGPTKSRRAQGTYSFRSSQLATVSLFVVPVDQAVQSQHYQAVIYTE
jgi:hypothetical protein